VCVREFTTTLVKRFVKKHDTMKDRLTAAEADDELLSTDYRMNTH